MKNNKLTNSQLGLLGERIASQFLERHNLNIIDKNFRTKWGEIDIITMSNMSLRFIEVKTKGLSMPFSGGNFELVKVGGSEFKNPLHRVDRQKIQRIKKSAYIYLSRNMPHVLNNNHIEISFDVLSVVVNVSLSRAQVVWYKDHLS